jgi:hypothetical protein
MLFHLSDLLYLVYLVYSVYSVFSVTAPPAPSRISLNQRLGGKISRHETEKPWEASHGFRIFSRPWVIFLTHSPLCQ